MYPTNESETIELYQLVQCQFGWTIVLLHPQFPDAVIEKNGQRLLAEFEYSASNFQTHGHDINACDIIICWRNDWPDAPIPIFALENYVSKEAQAISKAIWDRQREDLTTIDNLKAEIQYLRKRIREMVTRESEILDDLDMECAMALFAAAERKSDISIQNTEKAKVQKMKTKSTTVRLPADVYEQAKTKAQAEYLSFNQLICRLIKAYISEDNHKENKQDG